MKPFHIFIILLCGTFQFSNAQKYAVKISVGYNLPLASQYITKESVGSYDVTYNQFSGFVYDGENSEKGIYGSYGAGLQFTGAFQRMVTDNIGFEVAFQYLSGKKYQGYERTTYYYSGVTYPFNYQETDRGQAAFVMPSVILTSGDGMVAPYVVAGLCFGKATLRTNRLNDDGSEEVKYSTKRSGNMAVGLRGGTGANVKLTPILNLFSEVIFVGMSYYPKEEVITTYTVDGTNHLNDLKENVRKTIFRKSITTKSGGNSNNENQPNEQLRYSIPFSNLSVNVGIKVSL